MSQRFLYLIEVFVIVCFIRTHCYGPQKMQGMKLVASFATVVVACVFFFFLLSFLLSQSGNASHVFFAEFTNLIF